MASQTAVTNKKAFRDYFIIERYECGIELKGCEVKSIRQGGLHFKDSFARFDGEQLFLYNVHINPYAQASYMNPEPDRPRRLLLQKKEIKKILGAMTQKGLTLVPSSIYFNKRNFVKIEISLAKGKKLYDKRDAIKSRDLKKQIARIVRTRKKSI